MAKRHPVLVGAHRCFKRRIAARTAFVALFGLGVGCAGRSGDERIGRGVEPSEAREPSRPSSPAGPLEGSGAQPAELEAPADFVSPPSDGSVQEERDADAPPASFRGARFLHIGDSFAGALGLKLGEKLRAEGATVFLEATDSSYIVDWAHRKSLDRLVWKYNPDLVIVTLGANELAMEKPEQRARAVRKIVEQIGDRPCVWVAIPYWNEAHNTLMDVVRENVAPCLFHDTNALYDVRSMPRVKDGIHPTEDARLAWAGFFFEWLREHRQPGDGRGYRLRP